MEESLSKFMNESAKRHKENSNLIKKIRASTDAAIRNQGASIKDLEIQIRQMSKVLQKRGFGSLPSSTEINLRDHVNSISTTVDTDTTPIRCIGSTRYAKVSYGLQCLDAYSNRATLLDDSLPKKEKDLGSFILTCYINSICFEKALADLGASIDCSCLQIRFWGIAENVLIGIGKFVFPIYFIILDMPEDINVPLILGRPFLSTAHAKIDVFKKKITLRVGDEKIIFKSVKPASSLIRRVYMLSLRERMDLYLEARLMGETLILNRSFDPLYGDCIELNDLNEPLELRRNRVDDLEPTVEECEVVNEPMMDIVKTRCDFIGGLDDYPSNCDFDRRIHIDCAYNLKFSCMMGFEYVHANFFLILPINVMSKKFYNSIMKDKIKFKGRNELGNFVNEPVFIGNFYVITNFTIVEDMDPYLDEGMGDVIVGEPFCKASCVETKRLMESLPSAMGMIV
ncbi:homeodomain-like protein [Tanacetum coccineum]